MSSEAAEFLRVHQARSCFLCAPKRRQDTKRRICLNTHNSDLTRSIGVQEIFALLFQPPRTLLCVKLKNKKGREAHGTAKRRISSGKIRHGSAALQRERATPMQSLN